MTVITETHKLARPVDASEMESYLKNLEQALKVTVHSDRLNEIYETCIRDTFQGLPLRLADLTPRDMENIDLPEAIKHSLLGHGSRMKRAELSGSCLDVYAMMVVLLNSQLLELEVMESRSKKSMEQTAFKAMMAAVSVTNTMATTQLIVGGAGSVFGLASAVVPNQGVQRALLAVSQNAPTAGQFFTTKQQADLTLSQHDQQVATEKWRSKQEQAKQVREEVRRSLDQLIEKLGQIFQRMNG